MGEQRLPKAGEVWESSSAREPMVIVAVDASAAKVVWSDIDGGLYVWDLDVFTRMCRPPAPPRPPLPEPIVQYHRMGPLGSIAPSGYSSLDDAIANVSLDELLVKVTTTYEWAGEGTDG